MQTFEFRALLEAERPALASARDALRRHVGPTWSGLGEHLADAASDTLSIEFDLAVLHDLESDVAAIDAALARLADGTYGSCRVCGLPIAEGRLQALPATTLCVDHQRVAEHADRDLRRAVEHSQVLTEGFDHLDLLRSDEPTVPVCAEESAVHMLPG